MVAVPDILTILPLILVDTGWPDVKTFNPESPSTRPDNPNTEPLPRATKLPLTLGGDSATNGCGALDGHYITAYGCVIDVS